MQYFPKKKVLIVHTDYVIRVKNNPTKKKQCSSVVCVFKFVKYKLTKAMTYLKLTHF